MDRRIPYHLKGKGKTGDYSPPPRKRIRAPDLENSDLIKENSLTLMGRLTNPTVQRLWSLIPFLSNRWNLKGKAIGSDLGRGCFQFLFDFEEDLQKVLDNRPYHFDQWMVILQRWEPVISASFPSMIPFWIEIQGLPKHFWKPKMMHSIAEDIGEVIEHEITPTVFKMKLLIDGLKPLIKDTIVEFPDGSEVLVTLEYKNLKNHCLHCFRLSHEKKDCPGLEKTSNKTLRSSPLPSREPAATKSSSYYQQKDVRAQQKVSRDKTPSKNTSYTGPTSHTRRAAEDNHRYQSHSKDRSFYQTSHSNRRSPSRSQDLRRSYDYSKREPVREPYRNFQSTTKQNLQWREKSASRGSSRTYLPEMSDSSRTRRPPLERILSAEVTPPPPPPVPTTTEVMNELREVTVQYTSCADPTESAARKQRVLQGEARGLMAQTAAQLIEVAILSTQNYLASSAQAEFQAEEDHDLPIHPAELPVVSTSAAKKKRGRPPLNKTAPKSTLQLNGAKSSKRNKALIQNSPKSRNIPERLMPTKETNKQSCKGGKAKQKLILTGEANLPSTSMAAPKGLIVPAMVRKQVDFENPPNPLP